MSMLMTMVLSILLVLVLAILPIFLENKNSLKYNEQSSSFECGLDNMEMSHNPFSLRFFSLVIIFLIFDIELVMLMPTIALVKLNLTMFLWIFISFMSILLVGVLAELAVGSLQWMK